jgi:hypothetical protein
MVIATMMTSMALMPFACLVIFVLHFAVVFSHVLMPMASFEI